MVEEASVVTKEMIDATAEETTRIMTNVIALMIAV
jgi:hypothetical protein